MVGVDREKEERALMHQAPSLPLWAALAHLTPSPPLGTVQMEEEKERTGASNPVSSLPLRPVGMEGARSFI